MVTIQGKINQTPDEYKAESKKMNTLIRKVSRGRAITNAPAAISEENKVMNKLLFGAMKAKRASTDLNSPSILKSTKKKLGDQSAKKRIPEGHAGAGAGSFDSMPNKPADMNDALRQIMDLRSLLGGGDALNIINKKRRKL